MSQISKGSRVRGGYMKQAGTVASLSRDKGGVLRAVVRWDSGATDVVATHLLDALEDTDDADTPYHGKAPAVAGSATSEAAAEQIEPVRGTKRRAVFDYIRGRGSDGATRQEVAIALDMDPNTVRPRVVELLAPTAHGGSSLVYETAHTRATRSGRLAAVLRARGGDLL